MDECDTMGYNKCGFAACAYNTGKCVKTIAKMVLESIKSVVKLAFLFGTAGSSSFIKMAGNL